MASNDDLPEIGRKLIDTTLFMTLGTADERPARPGCRPCTSRRTATPSFYWVSVPDVTHSVNIASRPQVSIVVYDSQQRPGSGLAVYMSATAAQVAAEDLDRSLHLYNHRFPNPAA